MFKGEFVFDEFALREFRNFCALPQYAAAYPITNEPIEQWISLTPAKNPRVLTVAASGDQPLMYAAAGAAHVDTFDITVNACAMMDFKTTALQSMNYEQYINTIKLFEERLGRLTQNDIKRISAVVRQMPDRTRDLMTKIIKKPMYALRYVYGEPPFPDNADLYSQIRRNVHAPFNFIWSDLINVTNYIHDKYDIINLSNIFDFYVWYQNKSQMTVCKTIYKLWPYLNKGGYILCTTRHNKHIKLANTLSRLPLMPSITLAGPDTKARWLPIIIQKAR